MARHTDGMLTERLCDRRDAYLYHSPSSMSGNKVGLERRLEAHLQYQPRGMHGGGGPQASQTVALLAHHNPRFPAKTCRLRARHEHQVRLATRNRGESGILGVGQKISDYEDMEMLVCSLRSAKRPHTTLTQYEEIPELHPNRGILLDPRSSRVGSSTT